MLFWQFSNIIKYVKIVGKIPYIPVHVWLFSNPGDKLKKYKTNLSRTFNKKLDIVSWIGE